MVHDLTPSSVGLEFKDLTGEKDNVFVAVRDKFPAMGDTHIEGRRVVETSVELFVEMMAAMGFGIVDPRTGMVAEPMRSEDEKG